jgi:molybdate transport system substrate-binding protein
MAERQRGRASGRGVGSLDSNVAQQQPIRVEEDMKLPLWPAIIGLVLGSVGHGFAQAEIVLISPASSRPAMEQVLPGFEHKTGHKVKVTYGNGGRNKQQVALGEVAFDVSILQPPYPEVLASGNVVTSSATPLAGAAVGVAVKQGAAKPDLSTPEAVKRMLLAANSIYYPAAAGGAAAGVSFDETLKKLGIADQMEPKIRRGAGAVAKGDIELYVTFLSEMIEPGIDIVGPLPREISTPTAFVGFVSTHAKDPEAARELLDYLSSSEAAAVYRAHRMVPSR